MSLTADHVHRSCPTGSALLGASLWGDKMHRASLPEPAELFQRHPGVRLDVGAFVGDGCAYVGQARHARARIHKFQRKCSASLFSEAGAVRRWAPRATAARPQALFPAGSLARSRSTALRASSSGYATMLHAHTVTSAFRSSYSTPVERLARLSRRLQRNRRPQSRTRSAYLQKLQDELARSRDGACGGWLARRSVRVRSQR